MPVKKRNKGSGSSSGRRQRSSDASSVECSASEEEEAEPHRIRRGEIDERLLKVGKTAKAATYPPALAERLVAAAPIASAWPPSLVDSATLMPLPKVTFVDEDLRAVTKNWSGAQEIAQKTILRLADEQGAWRFHVSSQSSANTRYVVVLKLDAFLRIPSCWVKTCSCPEFAKQPGRVCKHAAGVLLALKAHSAAAEQTPRTSKKKVEFQDRPEEASPSRSDRFDSVKLSPEDVRDLKKRAQSQSRARSAEPEPRGPRTPPPKAPPPLRSEGPEGLGVVLQLLDAKGAQAEVAKMIRNAVKEIYLLCYTYDLPELQEALIAAALRNLTVVVCLDHRTTLSSRPRDQQQFAQQLQANRVKVMLLKGGPLAPEYKKVGRSVSGTGIQHAKTCLVDGMLVVGSCNWTVSSKANSELAVLIRLHDSAYAAVKQIIELRIAGGERLETALSRPRSRSASASRTGYSDSNG